MDPNNNLPGFVGLAEAAELLGLSTSRVRELDVELKPRRVSGRRVFERSRVEELARRRAEDAIERRRTR